MASGSFNISRTSGSTYLTFRVDWESVSNGVAANSSTVTVWVYVLKSGSSTARTYGTANTTVTVGSYSQAENGLSFSVSPGASTLLFAKGGFVVPHNADGNQVVNISVNVGGNIMSASGSNAVALDYIPRQANLTSSPKFTDEDNPTIYYSNPAGTAVDRLLACISLTGAVDDIAYRDVSKTDGYYTFLLTEAERKKLRAAATSGRPDITVKFFLTTVIGGVTYYSVHDRTFTVINCDPKLEPTIHDTGGYSTPLTGNNKKVIKGFNYMNYSIGATAVKEASIVSQKVTCGNISKDTSTGGLNNVESGTFIFSATDNRGKTVEKEVPLELIEYVKLTCDLNIDRPEVSIDSTEAALDFTISGNYFDDTFGAVHNTLDVYYRFKTNTEEFTDDDWIKVDDPIITGSSYSVNVTIEGLNYQTIYKIQTKAKDKVATLIGNEQTIKVMPMFDWGENDFNFNVPVTIIGRLANSRHDISRICKAYTQQTDISYPAGGFIKLFRDNSPTDLYNSDLVSFNDNGTISIKKNMLALVNVHIVSQNPNSRSWIRLMNYDTNWKYTDCINYGVYTTSHITTILNFSEGTKIGIVTVEEMNINASGLAGSYIEIYEL